MTGKLTFAKFNVAACRIVQTLRFAQLCCGDPLGGLLQGRFDGFFPVVRQLGALGAEEFDAIVGIGVVAGADHHAQLRPLGPG